MNAEQSVEQVGRKRSTKLAPHPLLPGGSTLSLEIVADDDGTNEGSRTPKHLDAAGTISRDYALECLANEVDVGIYNWLRSHVITPS